MEALKCPHCGNGDADLLDQVGPFKFLCNVCSKLFISNRKKS